MSIIVSNDSSLTRGKAGERPRSSSCGGFARRLMKIVLEPLCFITADRLLSQLLTSRPHCASCSCRLPTSTLPVLYDLCRFGICSIQHLHFPRVVSFGGRIIHYSPAGESAIGIRIPTFHFPTSVTIGSAKVTFDLRTECPPFGSS